MTREPSYRPGLRCTMALEPACTTGCGRAAVRPRLAYPTEGCPVRVTETGPSTEVRTLLDHLLGRYHGSVVAGIRPALVATLVTALARTRPHRLAFEDFADLLTALPLFREGTPHAASLAAALAVWPAAMTANRWTARQLAPLLASQDAWVREHALLLLPHAVPAAATAPGAQASRRPAPRPPVR